MPKKTISRIYKSHKGHFLNHLSEARGLQEEQLHRVRVSIKNLRVLMDLLRSVSGSGNGARPMLKSLEPVFKRAGEIRSASLNIQQSQKYRSRVLVKFREHLEEKKEHAKTRFLKELEKFDRKRFKKQHRKSLGQLAGLKEKKIKKGAEEYLRVLFAHIRADIFDINDDETLHQIRKRIKSIRNVGQLLKEIEQEHPFKDELTKINLTYEKIGKWHDTLDLVENLEDYVEDLDDPVALEKTAPLILSLKKKCLLSKRQIEKKLKTDLVM